MVTVTLFRLSGGFAVLFLVGAFLTGWFGPVLRKRMKASLLFSCHRWMGLAALACGLLHGFLYWRYLR